MENTLMSAACKILSKLLTKEHYMHVLPSGADVHLGCAC